MKILLTGYAGYVGSYLVKKLINHELLLVDGKYGIDIRSDSFARLARDFSPDISIHLAGLVSIPDSFRDPYSFITNNIIGTYNVLKVSKKVIFASSYAVYGNTGIYVAKEDHILNPQSPYASTKVFCEQLTGFMLDNYVILRLGSIYGNSKKGLIQAIQNGEPIRGDGETVRDYIHVEDVSEAFIESLNWETGIYNIGSGRAYSTNEVADIIGVEKKYEKAFKEPRNMVIDISKALSTGWKPKHSLEEYLKDGKNTNNSYNSREIL